MSAPVRTKVSLALGPEHEELAATVARWLEQRCPPAVLRQPFEDPSEVLPTIWKELAEQGWLGLHVHEDRGGQGFGVLELAVVFEQLGSVALGGPLLPTAVVAGVVDRHGGDELRAKILPGLLDGSAVAGLALSPSSLTGEVADDGSVVVSGRLRPVLGASAAREVLVEVHVAGQPPRFCLLEVGDEAPGISVRALPALDPSRALGELEVRNVAVPAWRRFETLEASEVADLTVVLAAAEAAGGSRWCLETSAGYARERVQFGRPIGQFQAVKHRLADMLVLAEQSAATAWDAALAFDTAAPAERSLAASVAAVVCLEGFAECAKACVQLHGGLGFTWEHDAHRYLKRAVATRSLLVGGRSPATAVAEAALAGTRRRIEADLPGEAEALRDEVRSLASAAKAREGEERRRFLVDHGLVAPHWPPPFGRGAGAVEQVVIDQELKEAGVVRPNLGVGAWALPTLIAHGTEGQRERFVRPTLLGQLSWCQLFSEPGAGSDLAALTTRARRVDGGWRLSGQKVWTSLAQVADFGICLARSDPAAEKHEGITYFLVDMKSEGLDIRPLRELTGQAMFNEVFLDEVFVPDDQVVGAPGQGWAIARTTLANERVSMSSGSTFGTGVESVVRRLARRGSNDPGTLERVGRLLAEAHALGLLGHRALLRSLAGSDPGPTASVRKLLGAEHEQRVQEAGLALLGEEGAIAEGDGARWGSGFLATRCLTIAGGTSEVQRNVIAERILQQPRDPDPDPRRPR